MNRLLIPSIEGRILTGIVMFVAIMILLGWVAINEPARMAAFERQHLGRSIERGAELYAANCSTCHGTDGRGIAERAPGLNSPHLFGYDYLREVNGAINSLQRQLSELAILQEELLAERDALFAEVAEIDRSTAEGEARATAIAERIQEINALTTTDNEQLAAEYAELAARAEAGELDEAGEQRMEEILDSNIPLHISIFEEQLEPLYVVRQEQLDTLQPAIDAGYLGPAYESVRASGDEFAMTTFLLSNTSRLSQYGWAGDLRSFLTTTLIHGRPGSQFIWGELNQMVSWSQRTGGALRDDQIEDIVNYMLNWDRGDNWTLDDLYAVNQFGKLPADRALIAAGGGDQPTLASEYESDTEAITVALQDVTGDPARGEALYNGAERTEVNARLGCSGCHLGGAAAPATEIQWAQVDERLAHPQLQGYTPEQYFVESIVQPNEYIVDGWAGGQMPQNYGEQMTLQDIADIIAYIASYGE